MKKEQTVDYQDAVARYSKELSPSRDELMGSAGACRGTGGGLYDGIGSLEREKDTDASSGPEGGGLMEQDIITGV